MIKLAHFHHATLPITDKKRADEFYEKVLGFTILPRPELAFGGTWLQLGEIQLHLVLIDEEEMRQMSLGRPAARHLAFAVDDYEETRQALEKTGMEYRENVAGTNLQFFCKDPDGNIIEFIKPGPLVGVEGEKAVQPAKAST